LIKSKLHDLIISPKQLVYAALRVLAQQLPALVARFNSKHPKPYTLSPTPYTLHPTTYTLHPKPYTLNPKPYTLNPTT